jgi:hypothetical protein
LERNIVAYITIMINPRKYQLCLSVTFCLSISVFISCTELFPPLLPTQGSELTASVAKWKDNRAGALSITYDSPFHIAPVFDIAMNEARNRGIKLSYEYISDLYSNPDWDTCMTLAMRLEHSDAIAFFGHGDKHIRHDEVSFDSALSSFSLCRKRMMERGFRGLAYAYPQGSGLLPSTQEANRKAGFICARGIVSIRSNSEDVLICPDTVTEPENWFLLPSLATAKNDTSGCFAKSHEQVLPFLQKTLETRAWLIMTYHAIGDPNGWGYFPLEDFKKDLESYASSDVWIDHMDHIALYIKERARSKIRLSSLLHNGESAAFTVSLEDGLPDTPYCEPLTVNISLPESDYHYAMVSKPIANEQDSDTTETISIKNGMVTLSMLPDGISVHITLLTMYGIDAYSPASEKGPRRTLCTSRIDL